jgi:MoxR-like ATPase
MGGQSGQEQNPPIALRREQQKGQQNTGGRPDHRDRIWAIHQCESNFCTEKIADEREETDDHRARIQEPGDYQGNLKKWIQYGASPRGTLALDRASRARAWLEGRDHVLPEDVDAVIHPCLRHRLILSYEANAEGMTADAAIDEVVKLVALP